MYKYKGWIPTNIGDLSKDVIVNNGLTKKSDNIYELLNYVENFSDTITENKQRKELELSFNFTIDFNNTPWKYNLTVSKTYNVGHPTLLIDCSGTIESNGITTLQYEYVQKIIIDNNNNIPNTLFTFIKRRVHKDLHHEEKIDNVIPVCEDNGDDDKIHIDTANAIVKKIKGLEIDAKRIYFDTKSIKGLNALEKLYWDAKGFLAYLSAHNRIFKIENETSKLCAKDVIDSLGSLKEKAKEELNIQRGKLGGIVSFLTLFISLNIVTKNNYFQNLGENYPLTALVLMLSIASVVSIYITTKHFGIDISSIFNKRFQRLENNMKFAQKIEFIKRLYIASSLPKENLDRKTKLYIKKYRKYYLFLYYSSDIMLYLTILIYFIILVLVSHLQ